MGQVLIAVFIPADAPTGEILHLVPVPFRNRKPHVTRAQRSAAVQEGVTYGTGATVGLSRKLRHERNCRPDPTLPPEQVP